MTSATATEQQAAAAPSQPNIVVSGDGDHLTLSGALEIATLNEAKNSLRKWSKQGQERALDIAKLDTTGALFLCVLRDKGVERIGIRTEHQTLLNLICGLISNHWRKSNPFQPCWLSDQNERHQMHALILRFIEQHSDHAMIVLHGAQRFQMPQHTAGHSGHNSHCLQYHRPVTITSGKEMIRRNTHRLNNTKAM